MSSVAVRLGKRFSLTAVLLASAVIAMLALMEYELVPDSEQAVLVSFLAAGLAAIFAFVGVAVAKLAGGKVSWLEISALVLGVLVVLWPVLFFWAYSSCPRGVC
jgi:hypothetical protein